MLGDPGPPGKDPGLKKFHISVGREGRSVAGRKGIEQSKGGKCNWMPFRAFRHGWANSFKKKIFWRLRRGAWKNRSVTNREALLPGRLPTPLASYGCQTLPPEHTGKKKVGHTGPIDMGQNVLCKESTSPKLYYCKVLCDKGKSMCRKEG